MSKLIKKIKYIEKLSNYIDEIDRYFGFNHKITDCICDEISNEKGILINKAKIEFPNVDFLQSKEDDIDDIDDIWTELISFINNDK